MSEQAKKSAWLQGMAPDGAVIIPSWDEADARREADAEARYAMDPNEAAMLDAFARCRAEGHVEHTCPACGDHSCLRCGVGWNV